MYIACMHISPINVTISFLPAELQRRDHLNPNDITGTGHVVLCNTLPNHCCLHGLQYMRPAAATIEATMGISLSSFPLRLWAGGPFQRACIQH